MYKETKDFLCSGCGASYRNQEEATRCEQRLLKDPIFEVGAVVRYTFFGVKPIGRDMSEEFNRWKVVSSSVGLAPGTDGHHQRLVQVEQIKMPRRSSSPSIQVFPELELV